MAIRIRFLVALAGSLVVVAGLGLGVGAWAGYRSGRLEILDFALDLDAKGIERYVTTLEQMRAGEIDQAVELLESWLDDVLIVVMASDEPLPVSSRTETQITNAFHTARAYRSAYPRTSDRSFVDEMVANVFSDGPQLRDR